MLSEPPVSFSGSPALVDRLRTESLAPRATLKLPVEGRVITASSAAVGTFPPVQFVPVSQLPPVGAAVVFHVIVDITTRSSRPSSSGRRLLARRLAARLRRRRFGESRSTIVCRGVRFMVGRPVAGEEANRVAWNFVVPACHPCRVGPHAARTDRMISALGFDRSVKYKARQVCSRLDRWAMSIWFEFLDLPWETRRPNRFRRFLMALTNECNLPRQGSAENESATSNN